MIKKIAKKIAKKSTSKKSAPKKTKAKKTAAKKGASGRKKLSQEELNARVSAKAYELYESRGYTHGDDQSDWYEAEQIVLGGK